MFGLISLVPGGMSVIVNELVDIRESRRTFSQPPRPLSEPDSWGWGEDHSDQEYEISKLAGEFSWHRIIHLPTKAHSMRTGTISKYICKSPWWLSLYRLYSYIGLISKMTQISGALHFYAKRKCHCQMTSHVIWRRTTDCKVIEIINDFN